LNVLTPRARDLIGADAWRLRDPSAISRLCQLDGRVDGLHARLPDELAASAISVAAAIELGFVARFFERLRDHVGGAA